MSVSILFGDEPYIIDKKIAEAIKDLKCPEMNLQYCNVVSEELKELVVTLPVLDDKRVVILSLDELKSDDKLFDVIQSVPETTEFIIETKKIEKSSKIFKYAQKGNLLYEFNKLTENQLKRFIIDILASKGTKITNNAYIKMVERMGYFNDSSVTLYSVEIFTKQLAFLATIITEGEVAKVIPQTSNEKIFELTKAILSGHEDKCFSLALDFIERGENVIAMLSALLRFFRLGFKASLFNDYKKSELASLLGAPIYQYEGALSIGEEALSSILDTIQNAITGIKIGKCSSDSMFLLTIGKINSILYPTKISCAAR